MKESIQNIISTYKVRTETKQPSLILSYLIFLQTPYLAFMVGDVVQLGVHGERGKKLTSFNP